MKINKKIIQMILFLGIPLLLLGIFFLPEAIQSNFILNMDSPSILSIFLSNYVHFGWNHLLGNILTYLIAMFLIFKYEEDLNLLVFSSAIAFFLSPFMLFFTKVIFLKNSDFFSIPTAGFSGIASFFLGYFLVVFYLRFTKEVDSRRRLNILYFLFVLGVFIFSFQLNSIKVKIPVLLAIEVRAISLIATIFFLTISARDLKKIILNELFRKNLKEKFLKSYYEIYMFLFSFLVVIFSVSLLIPKEIVVGNSVTNVFSHYIGYLFGIFSGILIKKNQSRLIEIVEQV